MQASLQARYHVDRDRDRDRDLECDCGRDLVSSCRFFVTVTVTMFFRADFSGYGTQQEAIMCARK
jgi:hypothetical protein